MLPGLAILMVSMHAKVDYVAEAIKVGALGYLTKDAATVSVAGLQAVAAGQPYLDPTVSVEISGRCCPTSPGVTRSPSASIP